MDNIELMVWLTTTQVLVLLIPPAVTLYLELRRGESLMSRRRTEPEELRRVA